MQPPVRQQYGRINRRMTNGKRSEFTFGCRRIESGKDFEEEVGLDGHHCALISAGNRMDYAICFVPIVEHDLCRLDDDVLSSRLLDVHAPPRENHLVRGS